jgi:hypothetical protein
MQHSDLCERKETNRSHTDLEQLSTIITRLGYLPFHESNDSDHRGVFIDIDKSIMDNSPELKRPTRRQIGTSSKPRHLYEYKRALDKYFREHRIYERAEEYFVTTFLPKLPERFDRNINALDKQVMEICLKVEREQCPKRHETDWSIQIHHQSLICKYWIMRNKGIRCYINNEQQAYKRLSTLPPELKENIDGIIKTQILAAKSIEKKARAIRKQMRKAINAKQEMLKQHEELRRQSLEESKNNQSEYGQNKKAKIIVSIQMKELSRNRWRRIRQALNPKATTRIETHRYPRQG